MATRPEFAADEASWDAQSLWHGPFAQGEAGDGHRRMFSALPLPAVVIDPFGFVRQANPHAADLLGLARHTWLQQRSILQFLNPDDRQRLAWRLSDRAGNEVFEIRGVDLRNDAGDHIPCDLHLVHLEGSVTPERMSLLVVVDRTFEAEFRQGEQQLRRQTQRLADVIWASHSGTWEWHARAGIVTVNERFAEIIGAVLADIEPLSASAFTALIHPDDRASMQAVVEQPHDGRDQPFDIRMRLAHRGGGWVWVQNRGRVLDWDEHDRPLRLAGALQDVSVEVEREQALRAAKEQAEASERKKSEWLANVSHEVRTPLNSVLGLVQLMQEWSPDDRQGEALARIVESAHLLRQTLDDLLDNAKLEAGQLVLEQVPLDLSELSRSVMAVFTHKAQESGVDLICRLAAEVPPHVLGDPLRLRQVINNLVANALKFTSRGSIEVRLGGHDNALGSTYELLVEVVDTGSGIAPEHLSQLFKPYYQADASTTRRFGGTGLGLSIAQRLVRLMGGRIGVDSQPGRGSRFWFTVPLALAEPSDIEADRPPNRLRAQRWSSTDYAQTKPEDAAEPVTAEGAAAELGLGSEDAHLWRALRESLVLQEHRALELCQRLIEQSDAGRATVLRKVLRHARNFNFEAALGELPKSQETSL